MFLAMKSRHRGPSLLAETLAEWCGYLIGIVLLFGGFFFWISALLREQATGFPQFFYQRPTLWDGIGWVLFLLATAILLVTHHHQAERTRKAKQSTTGAMQ